MKKVAASVETLDVIVSVFPINEQRAMNIGSEKVFVFLDYHLICCQFCIRQQSENRSFSFLFSAVNIRVY